PSSPTHTATRLPQISTSGPWLLTLMRKSRPKPKRIGTAQGPVVGGLKLPMQPDAPAALARRGAKPARRAGRGRHRARPMQRAGSGKLRAPPFCAGSAAGAIAAAVLPDRAGVLQVEIPGKENPGVLRHLGDEGMAHRR